MHAYIYARWSSLEQTKGSTLDRQLRNCEAFAAQKGWTVAETIIDRGRSAYTGANIETGNLGQFAKRVTAGALPMGSVLIVEELDRLSRQPADVMLTWLSPLVRAGLTICVTQTGQTIDRHMLDHDMGGLMMLMIGAFGGHAESRKKSERVGSAWDKKRRDAREGKAVQTNHRHPGWLRSTPSGFELVHERVQIVQRIFANRLRGLGKGMTAQQLNAEGVPTFRGAGLWTATYVGRVLCNRAVLGEWQPHSWPRAEKVRKPVGEPIADYYPRIIDDATFAAANVDKLAHQLAHQGRGKGISNLLGAKARCATCGSQMEARGSARYRVNKDGTKTRHYFLYCVGAKAKSRECDHQIGWTYDRVEGPLLDEILALAMDDQHFDTGQDVSSFETAVLSAKGRVDELTIRVGRLLDMLEDGDAAAQDRYRERREELLAAKIAYEDAENALAEARGAVSPEQHLKRVQEVRDLLHDDDEDTRYQARQRVKMAIQDIIEDMQFDHRRERVVVNLKSGLGKAFIRRDGSSSFFNLHKDGTRDYLTGEDRDIVRAYERRAKST